MKGRCEQNIKAYAQALISYTHAIQIEPDYLLSYIQSIECLILNNNSQEALHMFELLDQRVNTLELSADPFIKIKWDNIKEYFCAI